MKTIPIWPNRLTVTTGGAGTRSYKSRSEDDFEAESLTCTPNLSSITAMVEVEIYTTALSVLCGCQEQTLVTRHTAITLPTEPSPQASTPCFFETWSLLELALV